MDDSAEGVAAGKRGRSDSRSGSSGNDEKLAQFIAFTGAPEDVANHWLEASESYIYVYLFFCDFLFCFGRCTGPKRQANTIA